MIIKNLDVNSIEIDMPISEANVEQKVASFKTNGMIQPIAVWEHEGSVRVVDGFHRLEAARRLGWSHLAVAMVECDEEGFWDARIQSAKQHETLSRERLIQWITECWRHSTLSDDKDNALSDFAIRVWDEKIPINKPVGIDLSYLHGMSPVVQPAPDPDSESNPVRKWILIHAKKWGISTIELTSIVFSKILRWDMDGASDSLTKVAHERNMSLPERQKLDVLAPLLGPFERRHIHSGTVKEFLDNNPQEITAAAMRAFVDTKERQAIEKIRTQDDATMAARQLEGERYRNSPEGKKTAQDQIRNDLLNRCNSFKMFMDAHEAQIKSLPDGLELVANVGITARDILAKLWPSRTHKGWKVPTLLEEMAKLRREIDKEHRLRIIAEAQLLKKDARAQKLQERMNNAIAWAGQ